MGRKGNVVGVKMFERVLEERNHYKRKCEEYCKRIMKLGKELNKLKEAKEDD